MKDNEARNDAAFIPAHALTYKTSAGTEEVDVGTD